MRVCHHSMARVGSVMKTIPSLVAVVFAISICDSASASPEEELARFKEAERIAKAHIATFDELDFDVFTHQKWDRLKESHSQDVVVHWPDGHQTQGIEKHIEDLKAMFTYAPDTRIQVHPVTITSGERTSVIRVMEG